MKKGVGILSLIAVLLLALTTWHVFAVDQMKSIDMFVGDSDVSVTNTTVNKQFSIYVGDSLSGVTNPIKSVYFTVSGVYASSAILSLGLQLESDAATLQNFSLPSVAGTPTPFEILYKDTTNKISPTSAGTYTYTLNIIVPSGMTIYGWGANINVTYRYAPAACADGTTQKIKTSESFVGDSDVAITTQVDRTFSLYIGDNLSGVTNPLKSVYFTISGVYTGGAGSLELKIDSLAASSQVFSLPAVTSPTPFEILYKDPNNTINPTSAGSYTYTLNIIPSSVTVYGLGAKVTYSHRYVPPSCGGTATGELASVVFDTGVAEGAAYNSIMWKGTIGTGKARLKLATSNSSTGPWDYRGPEPACSIATTSDSDWYVASSDTPLEIGCITNHNNKRYFRYKVQLCRASDCVTGTGTSPQVDDVVVSWSP